MTPRVSEFFRKLEFYLLCTLLFVLPILESPKHVALVLYLVVWSCRHFSFDALRRFRPDVIEFSLLVLIITGIASTVANWPFPNGIRGLTDTLRLVLVFWCIYRAGYSESQHRVLGMAIVAGVLVGLVVAVIEVSIGTRPLLELHSAGILTQSATYVGTALILTLGVVLVRWLPRSSTARWSTPIALWITALVTMAVALLAMASRGALLAAGVSALAIVAVVNRIRLWMMSALAAGLLVLTALVLFNADLGGLFLKSVKNRYDSERFPVSDLGRHQHWRIALAQVDQGNTLWLGVGPRNFRSIDVAQLKFDPPLGASEGKLNHAHNLFLTKLAEEGLLGLGAFVLFLAVAARALWMAWRSGSGYDWKWFAGFGALTVPVIAGSFNTPFFQEHALLAMAMLAIFLASRRRVRAKSTASKKSATR